MSPMKNSGLVGSPDTFTKEQWDAWALLPLEERARVLGRTPEEQAGVEEFKQKIGQSLVDGLNRHVVGETITDEMGRRQGKPVGPVFSWEAATEEFTARFNEAYAKKPQSQSADDFAREFVDRWPRGLPAMRLSTASGLGQPPYSTPKGEWPAFMK